MAETISSPSANTTATANATRTHILDVAQELVQGCGYNAFSYRDLSARVGVKTSSIHYYFPAKSDLAGALVARYRERFEASLSAIETRGETPACRLDLFLGLVCDSFVSNGLICVCGMLATDLSSLPPAVQDQIRGFFTHTESWIENVLKSGAASGDFALNSEAHSIAVTLFAALQGAMLSAYALGDHNRLTEAANWWRASLRSPTAV